MALEVRTYESALLFLKVLLMLREKGSLNNSSYKIITNKTEGGYYGY